MKRAAIQAAVMASLCLASPAYPGGDAAGFESEEVSIQNLPREKTLAFKLKAGNHARYLSYKKKLRTYILHIPKDYQGEELPMVVMLHGAMCNAGLVAWVSRMNEKADKEKFFVLYPNGSGGIMEILLTWNAGGCCGPAKKFGSDDVGFVRALIKQMKVDLRVDEDRVFVTGMSNGGMLAYKIGCELSDEIAAIAPVSACMTNLHSKPSSPISVLAINGTGDKVIPYKGGFGRHFTGYRPKCLSLKEATEFWVREDSCELTPERIEDGPVVKETFKGGRQNTEVCVFTIDSGDHVWPGGRLSLPPDRNSDKLNATDIVWDFFASHPKVRLTDPLASR